MKRKDKMKAGNAITSQIIFNREAFLKRWEKKDAEKRLQTNTRT